MVKKVAICSMTGFGGARAMNDSVAVDAEIRSVNHRFLDVVIKGPRSYQSFEAAIRNLIAAKIARGRVEVTLNRTALAETGVAVRFNRPLFEALLQVYRDARGGATNPEYELRAVLEVMARREVIELGEEVDKVEKEGDLVLSAVEQALTALSAMRAGEGAALSADLDSRLTNLIDLHRAIGEIAILAPANVKKKLLERLLLLAPEIRADQERLLQEAAVLADRIDVSEELVRLKSHFDQFRALQQTPPCGRKLDFLLQEIGREFNTIGSKAQDAKVQALVVDAKAELEKVREQVQNIE